MSSVRSIVGPAVLAAGLALGALGAAAQDKPPKVQLWIDLSTGGMAGMPEMDNSPMAGGLLSMMAGGGGPGAPGRMYYGMARGAVPMPPRIVDIALYNSLRPGTEARQVIPPGMGMGDSLPMLPPAAEPRQPGEPAEEYVQERPRGRVLLYWGCGPEVRSGQPRVVDLAQANPAQFAQVFGGRVAPERGARVGPAYALYPNERSHAAVPQGSSLVGEHQVLGEGVPASMRFTLGSAQDLMPPIALSTSGSVQDSIATQWQPAPHARAYFLHAMAHTGDDMILWSSAETADAGMGLFDYLPNATIERWVRERVLLDASTTQCAIPRGIFGSAGRDATPMLRMIAYGGESHFVHPPRPADRAARWEPEWAVRVRVKAHTMALLGEETGAVSAPAAARAARPGAQDGEAAQEGGSPLDAIINPGNLLRGILGR